jgi:hypothetical protein
MTQLRIYPEKNSVAIVSDADESTDRIFSAITDDRKETDGEYTYYRMKLDEFMNNLKTLY